MKRNYFVCLFLCLTSTLLLSQSNPVPLTIDTARAVPGQADPKAQTTILDQYGKLPLGFEANRGQTDERVKFLSRTGGYTLFLTGDEAVIAWRGKKTDTKAKVAATATHPLKSGIAAIQAGDALRMTLRHANPAVKVTGMDELPGTSNYFIGNDPTKWRTSVPAYKKVKYEGIYSGIDLVYYGNQRELEYDFIVAPGADLHCIAFDVRGAKRIHRNGQGDLVLKMGEGEIRLRKPVVYQEKNGARQKVAAHYAITDTNRVKFEVAKYDTRKTLYIDPLIYSTYLGGSSNDYANGIAVDSAGNAYVTGDTSSTNFPTTPGAFQTTSGSSFVAEINPMGSGLVYSTYLGGGGATSIAIDSAGNAYVTGLTGSTDFPVTPGAFQTTFGGGIDAFVTKLNSSGSALGYSTYLGGIGHDAGVGIAVDSSGDAYVTGYTSSTDFPVTPGAFQAACGGSCTENVFVTEINPMGSGLVYSTYLGGSASDDGKAIAIDSSGNAYVTGTTGSTDFPVTPGAFQTICNGGSGCNTSGDAFVTKLNPTGSALVYSTYLGGSGQDNGSSIAVDNSGNAYVAGLTCSTNFPTVNPLQQNLADSKSENGCGDAFVTKLNPSGSALLYSTYLGGNDQDSSGGVTVDSSGNAYVTGYSYSTNFPTMNPLQPASSGEGLAFVVKINPTPSDVMLFPLHLAFDNKMVGIAQVSKLTNAGKAPLTITSIAVTGANSGDFTETNNCGASVRPGKTCSISVTLTAPTTEKQSATVNIVDSDPDSPQSLSLSTDGLLYSSIVLTYFTRYKTCITVNTAVYFEAFLGGSRRAGPPTGVVTFSDNGEYMGSAQVGGGSRAMIRGYLQPGWNYIAASYGGDSNYAPSTPNTVSLYPCAYIPTHTSISSSVNPSTYGQPVTFTATVGSDHHGPPPNGETITFEGETFSGTAALSGGSASFTTSALPLGMSKVTAVYGGDAILEGSTSQPLKQTNKATTTTALVSSLNPAVYGQAITYTATVTSTGSNIPTGNVKLTDMGVLPLIGGEATITKTNVRAGTYAITAEYLGDNISFPSTSPVFEEVVNPAPTTTVLTSSANPSSSGQTVTFTATVTSSTGLDPFGTVTFTAGTTTLGTVAVSDTIARISTATLPVGSIAIAATYNGATGFIGSSASLTQIVN